MPEKAESDPQVKGLQEKIEKAAEKMNGLGDEFRKAKETQDAEIAKFGKSTEDTAKKLDETFAELQVTQGELQKMIEEAGTRIDEIEKKGQRPRGGPSDEEVSIAKKFLQSETYKRFKGDKSATQTGPVGVGSLLEMPHRKGTLTTTSATRLIPPLRTEMITPMRRMLRVRDLMPVRSSTANAFEYIEEIGFHNNTPTAVTTLTQTGGLATATLAGHGFQTGDLVRMADWNQAGYNGTHRITRTGADTFTFAVDSGTVSPATGTGTVLLLQQHGAATPRAEGSASTEATIELDLKTANSRIISHFTYITREAAEDDAQLEAYLEDRLLFGLEFKEEDQLLYGDGTGQNQLGLLANPNRQLYAWSAGPTTDKKGDAIRRAMTRVEAAELQATGVVMSIWDKEDIDLEKGTDGHYLYRVSLDATTGITRIWSIPIVATRSMQPGQALVGSFAQGATLWDRMDGMIRISDSHASTFTSNVLTLKAEERVALVNYRPEAFVDVDLTTAPS